jgi:hypothetical protein
VRRAGLQDQRVGDGGPGEAFWRAFLTQLGPALIGSGLIGEAEFAAGLAAFDDPLFLDVVAANVSAWGRAS